MEVSLWLTQTNHKRIFPRFLRQEVIRAQATKWIDPFVYLGPPDVLELSGTELRNAVVAQVCRSYAGQGIWLDDSYDGDDQVPVNADLVAAYTWQHGDSIGQLQAPH